MDISVKGKKLDVGDALRGHVEDQLNNAVSKYFNHALDASVTFTRKAYRMRVDISVHPGPRGLIVQGGSDADDPYAAFDGALKRIAKHADVFTCRASGSTEWVARDYKTVREYVASEGRDPASLELAHVQAGYVVDTADSKKALSIQRAPMETIMGKNRDWDHLQGCYLVGSIDDIVEKLKFLESHGLQHVTIQPAGPEMEQLDLWMDKIITPYFR